MRVLFLTCHLPYPPHSGGRLREHQLLSRLTERHHVHVVAVTKTLAEDQDAVGSVPWDHDGISLFPAAQLSGLGRVAPQVARHRSEAARAGVRSVLAGAHFDLLHVEAFYLWQHVPAERPPSLLVEQNIEWELFAQRGQVREARATRAAELAAWHAADTLGALTREDRRVMRSHTGRSVQVVPDGADHLRLPTRRRGRQRCGRRLLMVGNFGYEPNVDGALWLAGEVLPRIRAVVPDVRLQLVGTDPPAELCALERSGIEVTGRVPDVAPYLAHADVVLCPLRYGGGIKVKVLEALAAGKAIVTTDVGCQGLGAARAAVRCACTASAFADATLELLLDPAARARAERRAGAAELPSWDDAAAALDQAWLRATDLALAAA